MSSNIAHEVNEILSKSLNAEHVKIVDESDGCGVKLRVITVSEAFVGKTPLERQRLVNTALKDILPKIHAFQQKTLTPDQWEKQKDTLQ